MDPAFVAVSGAFSTEGTRAPPSATAGGMPTPASGATARAVMLAHLHADLGAALAAGDIGAAQVAHEAIGKLLAAAPQTGDAAPVMDLARERERRGR